MLTIDPSYYEWDVDAENERMVRSDLDVIRTNALDPTWTRRIGIGDLGLRTLWPFWRRIQSIVRDRRIDLVFISVAPFYSALLGRMAHERFDIPYVIDYQDPWVSNHWRGTAGRFSKRAASHFLAETLEPWCLRKVSRLTAVSRGTIDPIVDRYDWLHADDATEIPFGGDPAEFDYLRASDRQNLIFDPHDGLIHLSYVGAIAADMVPALRAILTAVRDGLHRAPDAFSRLRMHFVGTTYAADGDGRHQALPIARELGIEHVVDEHPSRVAYLDALKLLVDSHGLLVVGSHATHYTASKIFPYILAERPLIALFHERSSVVDILRDTGGGDVLTFDETGPSARVGAVSRRLEQIVTDPEGATPCYSREAFERYTARAMTEKLAAVFDEAVRSTGVPS